MYIYILCGDLWRPVKKSSNLQPKQITFSDQQLTKKEKITNETKKELILLAKIKKDMQR